MGALWTALGSAGQSALISGIMGNGGQQGISSPSTQGQTDSSASNLFKTSPVSAEMIPSVNNSVKQQAPQQGFSTIFQDPRPLDPNSAYDEYIRRQRMGMFQ